MPTCIWFPQPMVEHVISRIMIAFFRSNEARYLRERHVFWARVQRNYLEQAHALVILFQEDRATRASASDDQAFWMLDSTGMCTCEAIV